MIRGYSGRDVVRGLRATAYIFLRGVRLHRAALADISRGGRPRIPGPVRIGPDGRVAARVFPVDVYDRLTYVGTTADVSFTPVVA